MVVVAVACVVLAADLPCRPAAAARGRGMDGERRVRAASRAARDAAAVTSAFDCDTPRAQQAFGSRERCLRALCARRDATNAYVLDAAERLRVNPCAGVDPFELRR